MNTKIFLFSILFAFATLLSAQENISLTEIEKVKEYLSLNDVQYNAIKNIVKEIETIIEEDKKIITGLKDRVKNDDEPGLFEKIKVKRGHDKRADQIEELLEEIEDQLTGAQKDKYKNVAKPYLKPLSKKELTEYN